MNLATDFSIWIAAFLTLGIFSFLYRDNPIYKFCEHLFVGVSAGYYVVLTMMSSVYPNMVVPLFTDFGTGLHALLLIPLVLSIMLFSRFFPRGDWLSRWPIAFILGVYPALRITGFGQGDLVEQVHGSILPLWLPGDPGGSIGNILLVLGLVAYGTYDLTNQATLRVWATKLTLIDMAYGSVLTACAATASFLVVTRLLKP